MRPTLTEFAPEDIDLLNRYFSTKTVFDVKLDCDEEARQTLEASLTDPHVRHAVSSLRALREDFESSRDGRVSVAPRTADYNYGVQQYSMALGGLASKLSSPGSNELKSALLCCQIFISIEQVQGNFSAMGRHIIQGLRIMHEYRVRPGMTAAREMLPAHSDQLPLLDVFIVKQFAAPCKFTEPPVTKNMSGTVSSVSSGSPPEEHEESRSFRTIAPNMRTGLTRIAASTLEFLDRVSGVGSVEDALQLLSEKAALLKSLDAWFLGLDLVQMRTDLPVDEAVSVSFMRLNHAILRIILLGALESSLDLKAELQIENDRLQAIADSLGERLVAYKRY